jgi:hypothetical protein
MDWIDSSNTAQEGYAESLPLAFCSKGKTLRSKKKYNSKAGTASRGSKLRPARNSFCPAAARSRSNLTLEFTYSACVFSPRANGKRNSTDFPRLLPLGDTYEYHSLPLGRAAMAKESSGSRFVSSIGSPEPLFVLAQERRNSRDLARYRSSFATSQEIERAYALFMSKRLAIVAFLTGDLIDAVPDAMIARFSG